MWPMEMMTTPQRSIDLKYNANEVCATCMEFPRNETNEFYVGAEDNSIYSAQLQSGGDIGKESGVVEIFQSHCAPITSLSFHPTQAAWDKTNEYTKIMLTSSPDWSIKLSNPAKSRSPLVSFERSHDYVFDVKWCPTHPSVFASCDSEGYVDIWNINADMESPILHIRKGTAAIHRLAWSPDGKKLATGGVNGVVNIYNTDKEVIFSIKIVFKPIT